MRRFMTATVLAAALSMPAVVPALAASNPSPTGTGQPSQTCLVTAPLEPGHAASAPGSAFNENGGTAGAVYAGNGPHTSGTFPGNANPVSQYDVACFQVSQ
jgi:hypothetical protein